MILIDTNALVVLLIGLMDVKLINKHKRTSIYEEQDFNDLVSVIGGLDKLVVLPNVWTEVDNLLNNFAGEYKYQYITKTIDTMKSTTEKFIESVKGVESYNFFDLGLTDSLLLQYAKECDVLVTSDSRLSDYALAHGVLVYDVVKNRNERFR
jgi:predicted nucleic acid-binding protein